MNVDSLTPTHIFVWNYNQIESLLAKFERGRSVSSYTTSKVHIARLPSPSSKMAVIAVAHEA